MGTDKNNQKCCPTDFVIHTVSTRWTLPLVRALAKGALRPSELTKMLQGISAKSLTQRLRELEGVGLLSRTSYQEIPPRVVYELTDRGRDLLFVLDALEELGESWQRSLPEYASWGPNEQCAHCYTHLSRNSDSSHVSIDEVVTVTQRTDAESHEMPSRVTDSDNILTSDTAGSEKFEHNLMPSQAYFS